MTWLTLLLPASLICCRSPRTCCQGGGKGSKSVSAQLFSMMLTAASGHRYCKVLVVSVFLLLKNEFLPSRGLGAWSGACAGVSALPYVRRCGRRHLAKILTFLRGIPLPSGHCVALDAWGWMDSEPSARTALSDSGCTA